MWTDAPDYPFAAQLVLLLLRNRLRNGYFRIALYSTASTNNAAYIIGGSNNPYIPNTMTNDGYSTIIAEFKNGEWSKLGDLGTFSKCCRRNHALSQ